MFDIIASAPYFANGFLDPQVKGGPGGSSSSAPSRSSTVVNSVPAGGTQSTYYVNYSYNGEVLERIRYPDGLLVNYTYDTLGRTSRVFAPSGTKYANFSYYQTGQLKGIAYGNGLIGNYTYDILGRPSQIKLVDGSNTRLVLKYAYDKAGSIISIAGNSTSGTGSLTVNEQYGYDSLKRLTNATVQSGSSTTTLWYEYDNLGNRKRQSQNGLVTSYNYNLDNNELLSYTGPGTSATYSYSMTGGMGQRTVTVGGTTDAWLYTLGPEDILLKATKGNVVQGLYAYDGLGRRLEAVEGSATTFFAYLGTETLYEKTGTNPTDYVFSRGMRIARVSSGAVSYYHSDHLGSTRLVTSSSRSVSFSTAYQPFGQDNGTPTGSESYKFTGKPWSSNSQLYYNFQRWYDPSIGRFASEDPVSPSSGEPQDHNPYVYVSNRPTVLIDPAGLFYGAYWSREDQFEAIAALGSTLWGLAKLESLMTWRPAPHCVSTCGITTLPNGTNDDIVTNPPGPRPPTQPGTGDVTLPGGGGPVLGLGDAGSSVTAVSPTPHLISGSTGDSLAQNLLELARKKRFLPIFTPLTNIGARGWKAVVCGVAGVISGELALEAEVESVKNRGFSYQRTPPPIVWPYAGTAAFLLCALGLRRVG